MIIDMHTHGKLAKALPFSESYTRTLFQEAKKRGLEALCLTEHFNTEEFEKIYHFIKNHYPKDGDTFIVEGVRVFPGLEIDMKEGGHNLVIGKMEDILSVRQEIVSRNGDKNFLSAHELFPIIRSYPIIFGAAHIYRDGCHNIELPEHLIDLYDFFDLNGKDTGRMGKINIKKMEKIADQYAKPLLAGSDTHQYLQYGAVWNIFEKEVNKVSHLKKEILARRYTIKVDEAIEEKVEGATLLKKALKQLQKVNGRYDFPLKN